MAIAFESLHPLKCLAFIFFLLSNLDSSIASSTTKPQRFVSKLIHPNSVLHPLYNPNETAMERMELDIKHSIARLSYIQARIEGSLYTNDYRANISPSLSGRLIIANISIGQPPVSQLVIVDTGSDITWVMCTHCSNCVQHVTELFDPSKSSTYSPSCTMPCRFKGCKCSLLDRKKFNITYADNSSASGTYGRDTIFFETDDEGIAQLHDIEFGCCDNIRYNAEPGYSGILGLANTPTSLATKIGKTFSYCIGSLADKHYSYNQLILGEGADLEGYSTSYVERHGFYYLTMEGISIGERRLDIAPSAFEYKENGNGGVIIDSGCTLSYFIDDVYRLLKREVRNILYWSLTEASFKSHPWILCYMGSVSRDLVGFPVVTFHFAEEAELVLDSESLFEQVHDDMFCMNVAPASLVADNGSIKNMSVIGLFAQQSYNVGYNLIEEYVYFQRIDCELLSG